MVITTNKANITRASFDRIYDELSSLQKEVDTNAGTISVVGDQLAKVKAENSSLNSQINELDAEIVGKEPPVVFWHFYSTRLFNYRTHVCIFITINIILCKYDI